MNKCDRPPERVGDFCRDAESGKWQFVGQGVAPRDAVAQVGMVVEGVNALPAAMELSRRYGVELPIIQAVDAVVNHGAEPASTVMALMAREKKPERPS